MSHPAPAPAQRRRRSLTRAAREAFLEALAAGWSVTHAAGRAGVYRRRFYEARDADPAFAEAWQDAWQQGTDVLVDEVRLRAFEGVDEPVFQKGELVGEVRRFSDTLLMFYVKQRDPSFRENHRVEVTGAGGGPVELQPAGAPATLSDMVRLAGELGVLDRLGYRRDAIDGEAVEEPAALEAGDRS